MRVRVGVSSIIFIYIYIFFKRKFLFLFGSVLFYICIWVLPRNVYLWKKIYLVNRLHKLQKIADTFPCYLGCMLV